MGYQVGNFCYTDKQLAENTYFSQVVPVLTDKGIHQLQYIQGNWYYRSQKLNANLPVCDPVQNYKEGYALVMELVPTAVVLASTLLLIRIMR